MDATKTRADIVNVVATASIDQRLDFYVLRELKWIFHDPDVYRGRVAYLKMPDMQGKITIFASGKMISIGTKSEKKAYSELEAAEKYLVEKVHVRPVKLHPKTQNIVVRTDFERNVDLENLVLDSNEIIYEPEQFPGAILRTETPFQASIIVFASGKAIITGLKSSKQILPTVRQLRHFIEHRARTRSFR
jgi:transcription initiation factor TFIID TATA-box-binding protein